MPTPQSNISDKISGIYHPIESPKAIVSIILIVANDDDRNNMLPVEVADSSLFEKDEYSDNQYEYYQPIDYTVTDSYYEFDGSDNIMPREIFFSFNVRTYEELYALKTSIELEKGAHIIEFAKDSYWRYRVDGGTWTEFPGPVRTDTDPSTPPEDVMFNLQNDMKLYVVTL